VPTAAGRPARYSTYVEPPEPELPPGLELEGAPTEVVVIPLGDPDAGPPVGAGPPPEP
jgi:hypothetical protein